MKKLSGLATCLILALLCVSPVKAQEGSLGNNASSALEASHIFKNAGPGRLLEFQASISTCASSPCWVLLFDSATVPANGAVTPARWYQVSANSTIGVSWLPDALLLLNGITLVCSTTGPFTLTATTQCTFAAATQ